MNKKQFIWIGIFILFTIAIIFSNSSDLKQTTTIKGNFKEVAFNRNQNNTGPVLRVYAVSVQYPAIAQFKEYGDAMPHTRMGNTTIYFFDSKTPIPKELDFSLDKPSFDRNKFQPIFIYERNGANHVKTTNLLK